MEECLQVILSIIADVVMGPILFKRINFCNIALTLGLKSPRQGKIESYSRSVISRRTHFSELNPNYYIYFDYRSYLRDFGEKINKDLHLLSPKKAV